MGEKMTLLPCPFCGSAAGEGLHGIPAVECSNKDCGASLHRYHREEAYVLWNMRHLTQPAQAVDVVAWRWRMTLRADLPWNTTTDAEVIRQMQASGDYEIEPLTRAIGNAQADGWKELEAKAWRLYNASVGDAHNLHCLAWSELSKDRQQEWINKASTSPTPPQPEE